LAVCAALALTGGAPAAAEPRSPSGSADIVVKGIVIAGDVRFALLQDGAGRHKRARGQSIDGWVVEAIEPREVVLRRGDAVHTLALFGAPATGVVRVGRGGDEPRTANDASLVGGDRGDPGRREIGRSPRRPTDWEQVIAHLLRVEGSAFNPEDPSKWGIKDTTLQAWRSRHDLSSPAIVDLMALSPREARRIYKEDFIEEYNLDAIPDPALAQQVFDAVVNHGPGFGLRHFRDQLTRLSGIPIGEQGAIGRETTDALATVIARGRLDRLRDRMVNARRSFLSDLALRRPDIRRQLPGLQRRAESSRP
jgi:hypothetical protein